ncbi:MAG: hypothetical protein PHC88_04930, partial [Terrimicrobiaceae bacterium]|nr:hypothetical protein [Terrimicrobiaceae bacterium]
MFFALSAAAQTPDAPTIRQETVPAEPFTASAVQQESPAAEAVGASGAGSDRQPVVEHSAADSGKPEHFSLWDFFSRFFELGAPGDPNHPDKLRLTIGANVGYDDNVFTTKTDRIASGTSGLNGTIAYNFGTERLKLSSTLAAGVTYYQNRPGDPSDYNGAFRFAGSYFVTRRLQVSGNVAVAYLSQPSPTVVGGSSRFNGDYTTSSAELSVGFVLRPRITLRLEFSVNAIRYADEVQNQNLGFSQQAYVLGLDYLFSPRTTLTAEYHYSPLSYYQSNQDSTDHILSAGFTTTFSPRLKWVLQGGAEARILNNTTT